MNARAAIAAVLIAVLGLGAAAAIQRQVDTACEEAELSELLYLPNGRLLTHGSGGLNVVIADLLWVQCIQYTAKHFHGDGKFRWLAHMGDIITDLDPYFTGAYRYIAMFLAALEADDDASLLLLDKGIKNNPGRWELPYEAAMVYLLNRREEPGSAEMAARYLSLTVGMGTAPEHIAKVAQGLAMRHDLDDIEREMWQETLANAEDDFMRSLAERKLALMECRDGVEALESIAENFKKELGRTAQSLEELFTARGAEAPSFIDPLGGLFFIDANGEVQNTSLLDEKLKNRLAAIQSHVNHYKNQYGDYPAAIDAVVDAGIAGSIPDHPYAKGEWRYDAAAGEVIEYTPAESRPQAQ